MKTDGEGTLWLHQSDIGHFMSCPEQFRVVNNILPGGVFEKTVEHRVETDAATIGTVFHSVIEHEILEGRFQRATDAVRWAKNAMGDLVFGYVTDGIEYRTESFGDDPTKALLTLAKLVEMWFASDERKYWLSLANDHPECIIVEWSFDVPFIQGRSGPYHTVRLAGTADILDTYNHRLVDWKTSSRRYERWEKQRWNVQPTVYTYAAAEVGLLDRHEEGYQFDYRVFNHKTNDPEPQAITVWRETGQWAWLVQMVSNMAAMIESNLPVYPVRDDTALCGPKWCPCWSSCKGMYVQHPEWK
jgi:PD-(D/E)XK nuclease superfamily